MNDADFPSINLDELRLVPDWLRDDAPSPSKQYANHEEPSREDTRPSSRGPRPGGGGFGRDRRDFRGGGGGERRRDGGRPGGGGPRGGDRRDGRPERRPAPVESAPPRPAAPAPAQVVFEPDDRCLASIIKQIRSTHLAYPLFSLARMFLQEPARHWVRFTLEPAAVQAGTLLYQLGEDGPVTLDRATLERIAFDSAKDRFYEEQTTQREPLKGNFTNVARERTSGTLLGPTNYHGYQPALRALYESRFSRRMSFEDYRRNIEVVSDPAVVERWKEEARTATTIVTKEGDPKTTLQSAGEARAHFRQHYFDGLVQSGTTRRVHGSVARNLPEAAMMQAIRQAHEKELRYPAQFVQLLRQGLQNAGLHIFKHRKRVVYVSLSRPVPFVAAGAVSENVAAILDTVAKNPLCTRKTLAEHILTKAREAAPAPSQETTAPEAAAAEPVPGAPVEDAATRAKGALFADLRFLVQAGHVIEFHNGTLDLPLPPKGKEESSKPASGAAADDVGADPAAVASAPSIPPTEAIAEQPEAAQRTMPDMGQPAAPVTAEEETASTSEAAASEPQVRTEPTEAGSEPSATVSATPADVAEESVPSPLVEETDTSDEPAATEPPTPSGVVEEPASSAPAEQANEAEKPAPHASA